ncbi:MAG TPA: NAD(P)/FAD-dependent oxidoreductase [Candidatus Omnitrophota bacterium]|nr:NAD(P)/FAD-dependent oxidoreductase [Candidatus Omnitrophota bacterium]
MTKSFDVLICGAGISGLYCGQRILEDAARKGRKIRVGIIESRSRVGGRIWTTRFPEFPDTNLELGAFRFMENHHLVAKLVKKYGLKTELVHSEDQQLYFLRGKKYIKNNVRAINSAYHLQPAEAGMTAAQLLEFAIKKAMPGYRWDSFKAPHDQIQLALKKADASNLGFKHFLLQFISNEAFCLIRDSSGYDSSFFNWNSREALAHVVNDFVLSPKSFSLHGGSDQLIKSLKADFLELGGEIYLNTSLQNFNLVRSGSERVIQCGVSDGKSKKTQLVKAKELILAIPQKPLFQLMHRSPAIRSPEVDRLLSSVYPLNAVKIFLGYDTSWWKKVCPQVTMSISDSPLRKTFYQLPTKKDGKNKGGVLLAAYSDMENFYFWDGLMPPASSGNSKDMAEVNSAVTAMLSRMHGAKVPVPVAGKIIRWSTEHAGAAFHAWKPGVDCIKVRENISKPVADVPVYICGEAYSSYQCWMEGALISADSMLNKYFDNTKKR